MEHAARGRKAGRKRLLEKLGQQKAQRSPAELRQDQVNKKKEKTEKKEEATSPRTSSTTARGETLRQDQVNKKKEKTEKKKEKATSPRTSSTTARRETLLQKVGNKKKPKESPPGNPTEEESSPDMAAVILGEAKERAVRPRKRQLTATQPAERTTQQSPAKSGVPEPPQVKARVPPPESARVSEELLRQRTEENRRREQRLEWQNWENAAKKYIQQSRQLPERSEANVPDGKVETKMEKRKQDGPTAEDDQEENRQSQPLTPLIPRDESPIGDGSTTEELEGEEEEQASRKEPQPQQARSSESWRKNTRPAEPPMQEEAHRRGGPTRAGPDCVSDAVDAAEHRKKTGLGEGIS